MAAYAEGNGWKLHVVSAARQKFWGKSLELIPEGSNKLEFEDGSIYTWEKPSSFVYVAPLIWRCGSDLDTPVAGIS